MRAQRSLAHLGEEALLQWLLQKARGQGRPRALLRGIGDDAAVLRPPKGVRLLLSSDMMLQDVHFDLSYFSPYQLGYKLVAVNVSDILAMGGRAAFMLFELAAPPKTTMGFLGHLLRGILDALREHGAVLVGGDLSASARLVLSATVLGYAKAPVLREGASPGEGLYVSGPLGEAACGLALLRRLGRPVALEKGQSIKGPLPWRLMEPLLRRHLLPCLPQRPPRGATAMIDVSDGLLLDAARLARASGVGLRIFLQKVPLSEPLREAAPALGLEPLELALSGGEDYQLLFTARRAPKGAVLIGEVIEEGLYLVDAQGHERRFAPRGYQHFAS
jgi:thiamine-monophosphate kinase